MSVQVDGQYIIALHPSSAPGAPARLSLSKWGWREDDGIRNRVPVLIALYDSPVLLTRDLISDATGKRVFQGRMKSIAAFVAETRRLAELVQTALAELQVEYV